MRCALPALFIFGLFKAASFGWPRRLWDQWPKTLVSSLKSPQSLSVGPRKSLVSCGVASILVLSLRPRLPLLGESPIAVAAHGKPECFVCGVKRYAVCVLCFSDFLYFLCDNALAVRSPARVKKGLMEKRRARCADELYPCVARCRLSLFSAFFLSSVF